MSCPPLPSRQLSDGERVRLEAASILDGCYERCGTFGCILANKHGGLHQFAPPPPRRAAGRTETQTEAIFAAEDAPPPKRTKL